MPVVAVVNPKGGVGKTTVATNLAGYFAASREKTMLGDFDRQRSAQSWLRLRPDGAMPIETWQINDSIARPPQGVTHVVLDTPAQLGGKHLRDVVRVAEKILVPLQPSLFDVLATHDFLADLKAAFKDSPRSFKDTVAIVGVRVDPRNKAAEELSRFVNQSGLTVAGYLRDTQNYVHLAAHGLTLFDIPTSRVQKDRQTWGTVAALGLTSLIALAASIKALVAPDGARISVRVVEQSRRDLQVLRGRLQPPSRSTDLGAMVTVYLDGGTGYSATADLSAAGLAQALERAHRWALACRRHGVFDGVRWPLPATMAASEGASAAALAAVGGSDSEPFVDARLNDRAALVAMLEHESQALRVDDRIVNWSASLGVSTLRQSIYLDGEPVSFQHNVFVEPNLEATASDGVRAQTRSLGGQYNGFCQQGGFDVVERSGLIGAGARIGNEAIELLLAPNCPSGRMSVLLMPDQMMLQIHESIGHPLELDRILGDERNFAGTSFVTPDMFGQYHYGSPLLNVTFDPTQTHGFASYAADDDGSRADREYLIRDGVLQRPLGSALSQARAQAEGLALAGVANARSVGWHRAPIDRMGNINIEAGDSSLAQLIASIEHGVMMKTNVSWSIDDSRNKFQFGCEWGRLIENGVLTDVVRSPNYRGVSATFWRSLSGVGDAETFSVMGTPFCGKGEPGQVIRVGHSAPACRFDDVEVFGAES